MTQKLVTHFECRIVVFCHQCGRGSDSGELQIISRLARSPVQSCKKQDSEASSLIDTEADQTFQLYLIKYQRLVELLTKVLPRHHPLDIPRVRAFASFEPKDVSSDYLEQEASKGKGAFIQALWTLYAKSNLYRSAFKAWKRHGPQNLTTWTLLAQAVLDGCYAEKWPDTVFQVPDVCSICLSPMHWPEKTHCGHVFHLRCLLQHLDVSNTCPLCTAPNPLRTS
ncbi:hypothetical protein TNCV_2947921 [Trichonephila clavipes]|nr:hypothetical protein TNCV_2947921 [Trichonephila clavipes]